MNRSIAERLEHNTHRTRLVEHPFFKQNVPAKFTHENVARYIGQWWHPLHYFPTFLARTISVVNDDEKTAVTSILSQEVGEGAFERAHASIYISTMKDVGFEEKVITGTAPSEATRALVAGYEQASSSRLSALGFLYGTEVADLVMVAGIGKAVRKCTGAHALPWVDIHVAQEPHHVEKAAGAVYAELSQREEDEVVFQAERMWKLWVAFFDYLKDAMGESVSRLSQDVSQAPAE
ncbi:MAG: iron-containing redox enzyme family protein [Polyangiaceae bacterium]